MSTNRISAYLPDAENQQLLESAVSNDIPNFHNPLTPPANFAPVPEGLLAGLSKETLAWQQELYRAAYQSALAALVSEALRRGEMN